MGRGSGTLFKNAAFIAASYLYGSLPFVHSLVRTRGVNLKSTGSGTVGGSNLWQQTDPATGATGWVLDVSKGALPVLVGRSLGLPPGATAAGATAGVVGQCWPIFLGFEGGRGVSAILGASAALAPRETAIMLPPMVIGGSVRAVPLLWRAKNRRLKELALLHSENSKAVPLSVGLSLVALPLFAARRRPAETVLACSANAALLLLRRLTANVEELKHSKPLFPLMISRLLYDRSPYPKEPPTGKAPTARTASHPRVPNVVRPAGKAHDATGGEDPRPQSDNRLSKTPSPVYSGDHTLLMGGGLWW